ncbi:hypothetical protein [Streptomyces sp. NPDC088812]|uniref:hypothetical protein n=1 Tax=Streptomyces sp. NPDC088812 TaxID=3365905 RepID=UPI0037FC40F8
MWPTEENDVHGLTMRARVRALGAVGAAALALPATPARAAPHARRLSVPAGETHVPSETTRLTALLIAEGGTLAVPDGYSLTMTVDGVETGSVLTATLATSTTIAPGAYRGDIVLTVAEQHTATFANVAFPIRQALYVGAEGIVPARSVLPAVAGGLVADAGARSVRIVSNGEAFDGLYVADGGSYTLRRSRIAFTGNGRCDFVGDGTAVVGTGAGTTLLLDDVTITNKGVVRGGVATEDGCSLVVKNSRIRCLNGVLPADYVPAGGANMLVVPWRLGISGNVRATNLLGANTTATYIGSSIESETWGAFSVDSTADSRATAINCRIANLGDEGYGTFADGNVVERILGCEIDAGTSTTIIGASDGTVYYGDSTRQAVASLNDVTGTPALPHRGGRQRTDRLRAGQQRRVQLFELRSVCCGAACQCPPGAGVARSHGLREPPPDACSSPPPPSAQSPSPASERAARSRRDGRGASADLWLTIRRELVEADQRRWRWRWRSVPSMTAADEECAACEVQVAGQVRTEFVDGHKVDSGQDEGKAPERGLRLLQRAGRQVAGDRLRNPRSRKITRSRLSVLNRLRRARARCRRGRPDWPSTAASRGAG